MKLVYRLVALLMLAPLLTFAMPASHAAAWDPFGQDGCTQSKADKEAAKDQAKDTDTPTPDPSNSVVCSDSGATTDPLTGSDGLLIKIINFVSLFAGVAAVVVIIISGLRMVTSGGNSDQVAGARRAIIYTAIGLAVIIISRSLVVFVLNKL